MAAKKSRQEEALKFLDDLDSFAPPPAGNPPKGKGATSNPSGGTTAAPAPKTTVPAVANEGEAAEVLAFLDEITQKSSEPTRPTSVPPHITRSATPTIRKSTERVRVGGGPTASASSSTTSLAKTLSSGGEAAARTRTETGGSSGSASSQPSGAGSWGWGSVWSTASAAIQTAKSVVDEQVKHLPKNEQARKWGEGVIEYAKTAQLDKLGQDFKRVGLSTLTDILNVVAPPISEHEVIKVWLTHDMQGYEGIETISYRALSRILEQVEGGDLIVNRGDEVKPKDGGDGERDLNAVEGYETALKMCQVNIEDVIKRKADSNQPARDDNLATTYSYVYLRIQPYFAEFKSPATAAGDNSEEERLQFLIYLHDPQHQLTHTSITQNIPASWIDLWDQYDWVEDLVAESLRVGVEVIGQEYVVARMGWASKEEDGKDGSTSVDPGEKEEHPETS